MLFSPFDTGDRCFIDSRCLSILLFGLLTVTPDENLVVKKMGLFATVFTRVDGTQTYYFNSQLFTKFM